MSRKLIQQILRAGMLAVIVSMTGCASLTPSHDDGTLQREAMAGTQSPVPAPLPLNNNVQDNSTMGSQPEISQGSGQFIRPTGLSQPRPRVKGGEAVTFNFENQPVQAVVKTILGDMLKQNYTIVPGVQGNISFSTSEPVDAGQALPILETLLSWTHNALVKRNGGYVVLPEKDAVAGNLVPSLGASAPTGGLQSRLFPLHYISATEMQKLIKPFARSESIQLVDPARNLLVMSGTPEELANYQSMVRTFDVDWLRGMSVGVFNLQYANVGELMPKLDDMFGEKGNTPLAGMLRFIPIERTNAMVVISTQPEYLQEVGDWIARIDRGGGNEPQLFVYDVRNLKASDLAKYLAQIYTNGAGNGSGDNGGKVGPGLSSTTFGSADNSNGGTSMGSTAGSFGSSASGTSGAFGSTGTTGSTGSGGLGGLGSTGGTTGTSGGFGSSTSGSSTGKSFGTDSSGAGGAGGNGGSSDQQYTSSDGSVKISSVDSNNQLMVRARPSQWEEIKGAITKLDTVPLQVQIETRILEVSLTGELSYGVQWYLQGLAGSTPNANGIATSNYPGAHRDIALGQGGNQYGGQPFFYSFLSSNGKFQVAINALETSGIAKTLSAPSLVVLNNQVAHIQVGEQIPVNQTSIIGLGATTSTDATASTVTYLPTGVILNVQPRVNPGGLVYLNVQQQVSQTLGTANSQGNYTIQNRDVGTQIAVQSGQTVLLGGLIQQSDNTTDTGIPILNRIPVLGRLFGSTDHTRNRDELIVLITPRIIRGPEDAKQVTDDYQNKFESLAPLRATQKAAATTPTMVTPLPVAATPVSTRGWPDQLQDHAEDALRLSDYANAQDLAMQSWRQGTRHGNLCERNWQVIEQARQHSHALGSVDAARKQQAQCLQAGASL